MAEDPEVHRPSEQAHHTTDRGERVARDPIVGNPGGILRISLMYEVADHVPDVTNPDAATRPSVQCVAVPLTGVSSEPVGEPLPVLRRGGGGVWAPSGFSDRMWAEYDASSLTTGAVALHFQTRLGGQWVEHILFEQDRGS